MILGPLGLSIVDALDVYCYLSDRLIALAVGDHVRLDIKCAIASKSAKSSIRYPEMLAITSWPCRGLNEPYAAFQIVAFESDIIHTRFFSLHGLLFGWLCPFT